jgi:hypothetical protein
LTEETEPGLSAGLGVKEQYPAEGVTLF